MNLENIQILVAKLPSIERFEPRHELDYYGFSRILALRNNLNSLPHPLISGWKHGWLPSYALRFKEQVVQDGGEKSYLIVNTQLQKSFLQDVGFENVLSGGLPFCYSSSAEVTKIQSSLLIVPCHTLLHIGFSSDLDDFFENALKIGADYGHVAVLEHQDSDFSIYKKRYTDVTFIKGASAYDVNSFARLRLIFGAFENMITNGTGSHLIYGSLEKMNISIIDPFYTQSTESLKKHPWYLKNSHLFSTSEFYTEQYTRKELPFFFNKITQQTNHYEWACKESGLDQVFETNEINKILGWKGTHMIPRITTHPKAFIKNMINYKTNLMNFDK